MHRRVDHVYVDNTNNEIRVLFTPTIPHCSMATLIGLSIRVRLLRALPRRFKVEVGIYPGTHASRDAGKHMEPRLLPPAPGLAIAARICYSGALSRLYCRVESQSQACPCPRTAWHGAFLPFAVNKQLSDKERVAAALENTHLLEVRTLPRRRIPSLVRPRPLFLHRRDDDDDDESDGVDNDRHLAGI